MQESPVIDVEMSEDGILICRIQRRLNWELSGQFRDLLLPKLNDGDVKAVLVDLSNTTMMDSSGIGNLVAAYSKFRKKGNPFVLSGVTANALESLEMMSLEAVFQLFDSPEQAISHLKSLVKGTTD